MLDLTVATPPEARRCLPPEDSNHSSALSHPLKFSGEEEGEDEEQIEPPKVTFSGRRRGESEPDRDLTSSGRLRPQKHTLNRLRRITCAPVGFNNRSTQHVPTPIRRRRSRPREESEFDGIS